MVSSSLFEGMKKTALRLGITSLMDLSIVTFQRYSVYALKQMFISKKLI